MSDQPTPQKIMNSDDSYSAPALKGENEIVLEIEYAIGSIEKSLARWEIDSTSSPLKETVLPLTILGSIGYIGSWQERSAGIFYSFDFPSLIFVITIILISIFSIISITNRFKDRKIRARIMESQIETATETLRFLRSWIDRSEMSNRLKFLMQARADYLEALVIQAKHVSKRRFDII